MPHSQPLLTAAETSIASGASLKAVYKVARERLPSSLVVRSRGRMYFTWTAAACVRIDRLLPREVPLKVRRSIYAKVVKDPGAARVEHRTRLLSYVVDTAVATREVASELAAHRKVMERIVEDPEIQGGAATFKGTRILVHSIAEQLKAGVPAAELKADYPALTDGMLEAAPLYAKAYPKRGRPKSPAWQAGQPASSERTRG